MAGGYPLALFMLFLAIGAWWESANLLNLENRHPLRWLGLLSGALLFTGILINSILLWAALPLLSLAPFLFKKLPVPAIRISFWMFISQVSFLLLAHYALSEVYEMRIMLFLFILIWINDSMAYVGGKLFGKHKLAPSISPGKSWEGLFSGFLFGWGAAAFFAFKLLPGNPWQWILVALLLLPLAVIGDLSESWLKRRAGKKDSGRIMPGHGGILDRFDSFLLSIPPIYYYLLQI